MKSFVFTVLIFASCYLVNAQALFNNKTIAKSEILKGASNTHSVGKLIWSEDFNRSKWFSTVSGDSLGYLLNANALLPQGWSFVDSTQNDFFWHWSDVGPRGRWTSPFISDTFPYITPNNELLDKMPEETTIENGFMLIESDFFNTDSVGEMIDTLIDMNTYIEFGPIDFSSYESVIFNCKLYERLCCRSTGMWIFLQISGDYCPGGYVGHWSEYKLSGNDLVSSTTNEKRDFYIDIPEAYKLGDSVYFRIAKKYASHYFTIVDDIKFYEAPKNNLILANAWADYLNHSSSNFDFAGGYTMLPKDVVSTFKQYRAAIINQGSNIAKNTQLKVEIFNDDMLVDSMVSENKTIQSGGRDTLTIVSDFSPAELGSYQILMTVLSDSIDEFPENNIWNYEFETTQYEYSRVRHGSENEFRSASARDWVGGGYDGDMLLVRYDVDQDEAVEFSGIKVYIYPTTDEAELAAIANGQYQMKARAYSLPNDALSYTEMVDENISSELYTINHVDLGTWVYLPFVNEGNSLKGEGVYYIGIEQHTGTGGELRLRIGSDDLGVDQPENSNIVCLMGFSRIFYVNANFAIDLLVNVHGNDTTNVFINNFETLKVYPNPFSDFLKIEYNENIEHIQFVNALGQIQKTVTVDSNTGIIPTEDIPKGIYIVLIKDNKMIVKSQILIKQ